MMARLSPAHVLRALLCAHSLHHRAEMIRTNEALCADASGHVMGQPAALKPCLRRGLPAGGD